MYILLQILPALPVLLALPVMLYITWPNIPLGLVFGVVAILIMPKRFML